MLVKPAERILLHGQVELVRAGMEATAGTSCHASDWRGRNVKYRPRVFTEQGVAMLSSVLRSRRAVLVNVEIMRAFVRLRGILPTSAKAAVGSPEAGLRSFSVTVQPPYAASRFSAA